MDTSDGAPGYPSGVGLLGGKILTGSGQKYSVTNIRRLLEQMEITEKRNPGK